MLIFMLLCSDAVLSNDEKRPVFVNGSVKTGHICTKYTCLEMAFFFAIVCDKHVL